GPEKILHDVAFDARLLRTRSITLDRVLDTSIAARYLGEPNIGLASLVEKYLGVTLDKENQQADWGERPFTEERLHYLEQDVCHLHPMAQTLWEQLSERDLLAEVATETQYTLDNARTDNGNPLPPWRRIKGWEKLSGEARAVLRAVAIERERVAED